MKRLITYSCMAIFAMGSMAQNQKDEAQMNRFISGLMKKMTLEANVPVDLPQVLIIHVSVGQKI